jgi:hypothetical protein
MLETPIFDDVMGVVDSTEVSISKKTAERWKSLVSSRHPSIHVLGRDVRRTDGASTETSGMVNGVGMGSVMVRVITYRKKREAYTLSLRGSPTKVDSGQNVVAAELSKAAQVLREQLVKRNGRPMRVEEVLVIRMYLLMNEKLNILEEEEVESIKTGNILVSNLTYASYIKFGETEEERDRNFLLMCSLLRAEVVFGGGSMQVTNFIKRGSKVNSWSSKKKKKTGEDGERGFEIPNSLLMTMEVSGESFAKLMIYQKDREIVDKGRWTCNEGNRGTVERNKHLKKRLRNHIRVDCTFSAALMHSVLRTKYNGLIVLYESLKLFNSVENVNRMIRDVMVTSGIPKLIAMASLHSLERKLKDEDREIANVWKTDTSLWDPKTWKLDKNKKWDSKIQERFWENYRIDLSIPYEVYATIDRVRILCSCQSKFEVFCMEQRWEGRGLDDEKLQKLQTDVQRKILQESASRARSLRSSLFGALPHKRVQPNANKFVEYFKQLSVA